MDPRCRQGIRRWISVPLMEFAVNLNTVPLSRLSTISFLFSDAGGIILEENVNVDKQED